VAIELRRFSPDDWQTYKSIRLEALRAEPQFFGASYAFESTLSDEDWKARLLNPLCAVWGLYDSDECIGLTGIMQDREDPTAAFMIASFMRSEYRRKGLSALYYKARIDWASEQGYKLVYVAHRRGNLVSRSANQKFGFTYSHSKDVLWPDGTTDQSLCYKLEL
jgi:GNAT superfamily N-acetyltransferase